MYWTKSILIGCDEKIFCVEGIVVLGALFVPGEVTSEARVREGLLRNLFLVVIPIEKSP